jgi:hypothetical protein
MEWPGRCGVCKQEIEDWTEAGYEGRRWVHKRCWAEAGAASRALTLLRPPTDRSTELELPMLVFLLMFHFGLGAAVAGWIMLTQGAYETAGTITLIVGIVTPLIGIAGVAVNIVSRRRIELIRQDLETQGGWRPGR